MNDLSDFGLIAGLITALIGSARWLVEVWFKKSESLENLKHENHQLKITSLKNEADNIRKEFESMKVMLNGELEKLRTEMFDFRGELKRITGKYAENQQSSKKVLEALERYTQETEKKFKLLELDQEAYGKVMVKSGKKNQ